MIRKATATLFAALAITLASGAEPTEIGKEMEAMNDVYKAFRKETDPAKGAELARTAQEHILKGIPHLPTVVTSMTDPAAKAKAAAEYRKMMAKVYISLVEVEEAFLANDLPAVEKLVETLKTQKKEGHDKFIEE